MSPLQKSAKCIEKCESKDEGSNAMCIDWKVPEFNCPQSAGFVESVSSMIWYKKAHET